MGRSELQAEPAIAIAWYWYYKTKKWARNPVGLMFGPLTDNLDPPAAFLALARALPKIKPADLHYMRELAWRMASPLEMARHFASEYPHLTAHVFAAYLKLRGAAPEELEYFENLPKSQSNVLLPGPLTRNPSG
jgi:hypothetical protein